MAGPARRAKSGDDELYKKLKTLGDIADAHHLLEMRKRVLEAEIREIKDAMEKYEQDAIELSHEQNNAICRGRVADGKIETKQHYNIGDRNALDKWIIANKHTAILQGRVSSTEYRDLLANGTRVPGVKIVEVEVFSTKKRGGKAAQE